MKFGISTASLYPMLLEQSVDELAKNDVKTIEIFVNTISEISPNYLKELKKRLDYNGQKVMAIHPFTSGFEPFMLFSGYDRRLQDALDFHRNYFEAMNKLGSKIFVFHGDRNASPLSDEQGYERFAMLRDLGKEFGITVAHENVERCKSRSLDYLRQMVTYLDGDVSLVFDNKQATRSGITYQQYIDALGKNIVHVHISDSNSKCDCLPLGYGEIDIVNMLKSLENTGFDGCVMIELYSEWLESLEDIFTGYVDFFSNN